MFKPVGAKTVEEYIDMLEPSRKEAILAIDAIMQKEFPKLERFFAYNMIGYGAFDYVNYKKETIKWPMVALASQKNYISAYLCASNDDGYIAEQMKDDLGKVSVGKSCIRFKKLEDLNLEVFKKAIRTAVESPSTFGM